MATLTPLPSAETVPEPQEFAFSAADFNRVKALIHRRAGIALGHNKQNMVYSRLARRLRATGLSRFDEYLDRLEAVSADPEWEGFVNALTTNLTSFFREAHHFPVLAEHLKRRRSASTAVVWCAASSTGEEAYSIAITACEAFGTLAPPVRVVASDIDTSVLESAARGVYPMERVAGLDASRLQRYFQRGARANAGFVRVRDELRALVEFRPINLKDERWNVRGGFDAIFCRNALIYFDRATQRRVVARFAPLLAADGLLFVGHSENLSYASDLFRLRGKTVYETTGCEPGRR
jgi:chemotaxis protein methyltransferase CheR